MSNSTNLSNRKKKRKTSNNDNDSTNDIPLNKINNLETKYDELSENINKINNNIKTLNEQIKSKFKNYNSLKKNFDSLEDNYTNLQDNYVDLQEQIDDLYNDVNDNERNKRKFSDDESDLYEEEINELNEKELIELSKKLIKEENEKYIKKKINDLNINKKEKDLRIDNSINFNCLNNTKKKNNEIDYFINLESNKQKDILNQITNLNKINTKSNLPVKFKILNSNLSSYIKSIILQKNNILNSMEPHNSEYYKLSNWINYLMDIPWGITKKLQVDKKPKKIAKFLENSRANMDKVIYGQNNTKDHIIQIISKMLSNPEKGGNVFAIYGSPGTGKTTIIKEGMAKALDIPFAFISLGGATDSSHLEGHNYTYEGSTPGKIIQEIKKAGCMNPIFYFDELDKVSKTTKGDEIINLLIHLTDTSQNTLFQDKYFSGIPIDLSNSIFIFSFNEISNINNILLDRMELLKVDNFKLEEKIIIARDYVLPELLKNYNINKKNIVFSDEMIKYIIGFTNNNELGIRNIKRRFENIISKLNILILTNNNSKNIHSNLNKLINIKFPITINKEIINILLNKNGDSNSSPPFGMYL